MSDRRSPRPIAPRADRRPGFSLIEATVAVVLLIVAMTTTVRSLSWIARDRRALDRRAVALQEAENLLDRLTSGDPDAETLPPEEGSLLPDAAIEVDRLVETVDGVALERITVTVLDRAQTGNPPAPVRLTTWVAPDPENVDREDAR